VLTVGEGADAGYRIDRDHYYLPDLGLTDVEAVALNVALAAVQIDGTDATTAGWKLGVAAAGGSAPAIALTSLPQLPLLQEAVARRSTVSFRYGGADRVVEPRGLLTRDGYWYLVALDRTRGALRNFRVDRIAGGTTVGEPRAYEIPADFDLRTALPQEPWELGAGPPLDAVVRVSRSHAERVVATLGRQATVAWNDDGSITVRLAVVNVAGFRSWLFGLLDAARIIGPPELVADVTAHLAAMASDAGP
jgi:proteasome accessory factor B